MGAVDSRGWAAATTRTAPGELTLLLREVAGVSAADEPAGGGRPLDPGERVGRFEIDRVLGRGGFGVVYQATDTTLRRAVALKLVRPGPQSAAAHREAHILREAEAAARLSHPNIVTVHELGVCEHGPYLVMELLDGRALSRRLDEGPLGPAEALSVARQVAQALAHAHRAGAVHRDLSPANVFLCSDGRVKVLDFGLAQAFGHHGASGGTPGCMAPEQLRQAPEDARTDVFALGILLHWALAGRPPFPRDDGGAALLGPAPAPPLTVPGHPALPALVARLLEKDPAARPADGGEVAAALERLAAGSTPPATRRQRLGHWAALAAALAAGAAAAVLLRPAAPPPRLLVAVTDATNATGETELDALGGLIATSLEQSRRLTVLSPGRLASLARHDGGGAARVDGPGAARLARALGAALVLVPEVRRGPEGYELTLTAAGDQGGTVLGRARGAVAIALVDRVTEAVRRATGEPEDELTATSATTEVVVTPNLRAYQRYLEGQRRASEEFDAEGALAAYRQALAADPSFAMPHLAIALLCTWHEVPGEDGLARVDAALAGRLPAKERRLATALRQMLRREFAAARPGLAALAEDYPHDPDVLYQAGEAHWHAGAPDGPRQAVELFRRTLALEPATLEPSIHLLQWLARFGPREEAVAIGERAVRAHPGPMSEAMLARGLAIAGDLPAALETARRAVAVGADAHFESSYALAELLAVAGDWAGAERELRRWTGPGAAPGPARIALEFLPLLLAAQGRQGEAQQAWLRLRALRCGRDCDYFDALMAVHLALAGGDAAAALEALRRWPDPSEAEADPHAWLWTHLGDAAAGAARAARLPPGSIPARRHEGARLLSAGRAAEASALLDALARVDPSLETAWLRGLALEAEGRATEAAEAFQAVTETYPLYGPFWQASLRPAALLHQAADLGRAGRAAEARAALARFRAQRRGADPGLPLDAAAAALATRLGG